MSSGQRECETINQEACEARDQASHTMFAWMFVVRPAASIFIDEPEVFVCL